MAGDDRSPADEDPRPEDPRTADPRPEDPRTEEGEGTAALADGPLASQQRGRAGADRATALERRSRLLLRIYPAAYRRERSEEIIGTLLEATPAGHAWPRLRDARALAVGGLRARAAQNRHLTTAANLRVAVTVGVALFLSVWIGNYLSSVVGELGWRPSAAGWSGWPATLTGLLITATVLLAWTAPRVAALTVAVAAAAAVLYFVLVRADLVGLAATQVACLAALVALATPAARPSRKWLWLLGLIAAMALVRGLGFAHGLLGSVEQSVPTALMLAVGIAGILWIGIDARLMVAVITELTLWVLQADVQNITYGVGFSRALASLPFLLVISAIAALAIWLLRRQSARTVA